MRERECMRERVDSMEWRAIQKKPIHLHKLKTPYRWTHNAAETYIKVLKSNEIVNSIKLFNNSTYDNNWKGINLSINILMTFLKI